MMQNDRESLLLLVENALYVVKWFRTINYLLAINPLFSPQKSEIVQCDIT